MAAERGDLGSSAAIMGGLQRSRGVMAAERPKWIVLPEEAEELQRSRGVMAAESSRKG